MLHRIIAPSLTAIALICLSALPACLEDTPGCRTDLDCRGERICVEGACVDPLAQGEPEPSPDPTPEPEVPDAAEPEPLDVAEPEAPDAAEPEPPDASLPDVPVIDPIPVIEVSPASIDFGAVPQGAVEARALRVRNIGDSPLQISRVVLGAPPDAGFLIESPQETPFTLTPGQGLDLSVTFSPGRLGGAEVSGVVVINSDDPNKPEVQIPLQGRGVATPGPCAALDAEAHDFGRVEVGASVEAEVQLVNCGDRALTVTGFRVTGPDDFLRVQVGALTEMDLEPGQSAPIRLIYAPQSEGAIDARLTLDFSEPLQVQMTITGSASAPAPDCPRDDVHALEPGTLNFNLCAEGDDFDNAAAPPSCGVPGSQIGGNDRIFQLDLDRPARVLIDLKDADERVAIDTVVYVRQACDDEGSQLLCSDDIPCAESDIDAGCEDPNGTQVRQSRLVADLDAGSWFIIADQYSYNNFACGAVELIVTLLDE